MRLEASRSSRTVCPLDTMPHRQRRARLRKSCTIDCGARAVTPGVGVSRATPPPTRCSGTATSASGRAGRPGELVGDREVRGLGFAEPGREVDAGGQRLGPAVAEFVEQRQQPLVAGQFGGRVAVGEPVQGGLPGAVGAEGGVPGAGDGGVDGHAGGELVVLRRSGRASAGRRPGRGLRRAARCRRCGRRGTPTGSSRRRSGRAGRRRRRARRVAAADGRRARGARGGCCAARRGALRPRRRRCRRRARSRCSCRAGKRSRARCSCAAARSSLTLPVGRAASSASVAAVSSQVIVVAGGWCRRGTGRLRRPG